MNTKLSSKGQVVLPASARKRLGLLPGAEIEVVVVEDRLLLVPKHPRAASFHQGTSLVSGLPVLEAAGNAPALLTSDQVEELQADIP